MTDDLFAGVEAAAGLAVFGGPAAASRRALVAQGVPGLLASGDPTLWGPAAEAGAKAALELLDTSRRDRELLPLIAELHEELADLTEVVLAGPGGTAEVAARTLGRPMTVLDDPDPQRVRALIDDAGWLRRTLVVLRDDGLRAILRQAYLDLGDPLGRVRPPLRDAVRVCARPHRRRGRPRRPDRPGLRRRRRRRADRRGRAVRTVTGRRPRQSRARARRRPG
nr:hypothetical protein GCM10020092_084450 [Actinoplanes digitatis]